MSLTPGGIAPIKAGRASSDGHYPTLIVRENVYILFLHRIDYYFFCLI